MSYAEDQVKAALARIDGLYVYKPPDDSRNWKPADFLLWWRDEYDIPSRARAAMLEVKQNPNKGSWRFRGEGAESLRMSQLAALRTCVELQMPYLVAVYWKLNNYWTLHHFAGSVWQKGIVKGANVIHFEDAYSSLGVGTKPIHLDSTLAGVIHGEAGL